MYLSDADMQAAFSFVQRQRQHVETQVNATVYPDIQYPALIPVDTSAAPWTKTVTYYSSDRYGVAEWINGNADDVPMAGTELAQSITTVQMAGVGYGYGYEEINDAQKNSVNLPAENAMAARRAYEEMVDRVALYGDAAKGFKGLVNNGDLTPSAAGTGNWAAATPDQIVADINAVLLGTGTDTLYTSMADTLLIPHESMDVISSKRIDGTATTLLQYLRQNNTYTAMTGRPLVIRAVRGLSTAGAGSTKRMVAYRRDPAVLKMHIPMPHTFLEVFRAGPLRWEVPGVFRLGGLDIRRPLEVRYVDGL